MSKRLQSIDFLRGMAIVLVLFQHSKLSAYINGWAGVDLFFVLSGFLVSGLLFSEYIKRGTIHIKTFLIRRGFKIYPLFWWALLCTLVIDLLLIRYNPIKYTWCSSCYWHELLFIQNYLPGKMYITWSLAVEEHFYLLLALLVWILFKRKVIENKRLFTAICCLVFIGCTLLRVWTVNNIPYSEYRWKFPTHLRLDSLLLGVLISYFFHFSQERFISFVQKNRLTLIIVMLLCLSGVFWPVVETNLMQAKFFFSVGYTVFYLGFGILLSLLLATDNAEVKMKRWLTPAILSVVSHIGFYSYAIYLFHLQIANVLMPFIEKHMALPVFVHLIIQFSASILVGMVMTKLVETPVLKLRDRMFPKKDQKAI